jgi:membrane protein YdbS with pleckstrin-like domain
MKCHACGAEGEANAVYCPKCGERLDTLEESMLSPDQPQEAQPPPAPGQVPPVAEPPSAAGPSQVPVDRLRETLQTRSQTLDDEETDLWKGRYSRRTMIGAWLSCSLITLLLVVVGAMWVRHPVLWWIFVVALLLMWGYPLLLLMYRRLSIRYRLTTQRFFHEAGILRHVTDRIEVIDMDDISYDQTILQRLVNVGTIHINSSDRSHPVLDVVGIENVKQVATMMDDARRKERIRRGLHIEAV